MLKHVQHDAFCNGLLFQNAQWVLIIHNRQINRVQKSMTASTADYTSHGMLRYIMGCPFERRVKRFATYKHPY